MVSDKNPTIDPKDTELNENSGIILPQVLDLGVAEELHQSLLELSGSDEDLRIDGSAVETATTPCVQLLLAAGKSAEAKGKSVAFILSEHLSLAIGELGLTPIFEVWELGNE